MQPFTTAPHFSAVRAALTAVAVMWTLDASAAPVRITVQDVQAKPLADAVVVLEPRAGAAAVKPQANARIVQRNRRFEPVVTVVPVGTRVEFPNEDSVRHHVYSFSEAKRFELKLYDRKPEAPITFDRPGLVVLGCNIHDNMAAWVYVADSPWFGKTPAGGQASLPDVPPGAYRLRVWHPSMPAGAAGETQDITVEAAGLDMTVGLKVRPFKPADPDPNANYK
jgi:plastocyanin